MSNPGNFVFQLESMSVDVSYNQAPEYEQLETDDILRGDATINLQIPAKELRAIFKFTVDSSDITNDDDEDIKYATNSSKWRGLDIFGDAHAGTFPSTYAFETGRDVSNGDLNADNGNACIDGENGGDVNGADFTTHLNGAGEFVRHLASEITGGHNSSDIFSNEALLLQKVKDLSGTVNSLIRQKISIAGKDVDTEENDLGTEYRTLNDDYNSTSASIGGGEPSDEADALDASGGGNISNNQSILGRTLLLQLLSGGRDPSGDTVAPTGLADGRARVYKVLQERDAIVDAYGDAADASNGLLMPIPVDAGDIIKFNVVVRPNNENSATGQWHGLGSNEVSERRYLVNLHLTGPKLGSTGSYMPADWWAPTY